MCVSERDTVVVGRPEAPGKDLTLLCSQTPRERRQECLRTPSGSVGALGRGGWWPVEPPLFLT